MVLWNLLLQWLASSVKIWVLKYMSYAIYKLCISFIVKCRELKASYKIMIFCILKDRTVIWSRNESKMLFFKISWIPNAISTSTVYNIDIYWQNDKKQTEHRMMLNNLDFTLNISISKKSSIQNRILLIILLNWQRRTQLSLYHSMVPHCHFFNRWYFWMGKLI